MAALTLYKINSEGIFQTTQFTPRDVILVSDESTKKLYIYKGADSLNLNEFEAEQLFESVMQQFLNSHIFLIYTTQLKAEDIPEEKKIKRFITASQKSQVTYTLGKWLRNFFLLQGFRDQVKELKNF